MDNTMQQILLITLLLLFGDIIPSTAEPCPAEDNGVKVIDGVCSSITIRSNLKDFEKLENCTVIEGSLHISLFEQQTNEQFEMYSFPLLREITDNLMLYRVYGLKTLRNMFPNLAVIRGRSLFTHYALVVYEMVDLEELGLISLQAITRGGVRLAKNSKLCYVDTVDWERLGVAPSVQDFVSNKKESMCANLCPDKCHTSNVSGVTAKRCWTSQHCQKSLKCDKCPHNHQSCRKDGTCLQCMDDGSCCHHYCLGGCTGPTQEDCLSCRNVFYDGKCLPECPTRTYMYFNRRCLTDKACANITVRGSKAMMYPHEGTVLYNAKPMQCLFECPANYMAKKQKQKSDDNDDTYLNVCVKCDGLCPKVCNGSHINSIQKAQDFSECTEIYGHLTIEILGGSNVAQELEKGLGQIKQIRGKLDIHKSYPLLNLFFLKSLENITGENSDKSLLLMDNNKLQELFPEENMKKMILKKKAEFDGNRELCPSKIKQFQSHLNLSDDMVEYTKTNGDLTSCVEKFLNLTISDDQIKNDYVILEWEQVSTSDRRRVLSYIINYKEVKDDVLVNIMDGRDACSEEVWMTQEREAKEENNGPLKATITNLKPYTKYAVYVQAYTLSSAAHSARTNVSYFTTNPYYPTKPRKVDVTAHGPHELHVEWIEPKTPNGVIDHYIVSYQKEDLKEEEFYMRDYCKQPVNYSKKKEKEEVDQTEKYTNKTTNCCACPKSQAELEAEAKKQEIDIYFEDYLYSVVYCKRFAKLPYDLRANINLEELANINKEELVPYFSGNSSNIIAKNKGYKLKSMKNETEIIVKNNTEEQTNATREVGQQMIKMRVSASERKAILPDLEHYSEYSIRVTACHKRPQEGKKLCSSVALAQGRTEPLKAADVINTSSVAIKQDNSESTDPNDVVIKWGMPEDPNGLVISFNLFYRPANQEHHVPTKLCISMREYDKLSGYRIKRELLQPGNYTFQIQPVSLAGEGQKTPEKFFYVPAPPGQEEKQSWTIYVIVAATASAVIVVVIVLACAKSKFDKQEMAVISQNMNYVPSEAYTMDGWEVERSKIRTIREIGQGSFGMVYEGIATGIGDDPNEEIRIAVKTVNDRAGFNDKREFLKEATTMKAFDTYHVVKLLGVVSSGQPYLVIMELMALGDLRNYLRDHRPDEDHPDVTPPCLQEILQMAGEVADGMSYLADKKFVHRDLAARNCMVAEDKTVKVGDFGMTRDIYESAYYRKGNQGLLPVRWMAPESLKDGIFSSMSDVWSYGVVIWEMVTLAAQPYQGLSNDQVVKFIKGGRTMDMPERCPEEMARLMKRCWARQAKKRPTFKQIIAYLLPHMNNRFEKVSYFYSEDGGHASNLDRSLGEGEQESDGSGDNASGNDENDDCSQNSLSCEGAAAPRHSLRGASEYSYGSPTPSAGSASIYDEGIDHDALFIGKEREHFYGACDDMSGGEDDEGSENGNEVNKIRPSDHGSFGMEMNRDDSVVRPFLKDRFQDLPPVMIRQPNGPAGSLEPQNTGLIELQPLLCSDRGNTPYLPSSRSNIVHTAHPKYNIDSTHLPHHQHSMSYQHPLRPSPPASTPSSELPGLYLSSSSTQPRSPFTLAAVDPLRSGPPLGNHQTSPGSPNNPLSLPPHSSSTGVSRPSLRLPTMSHPSSNTGGFKRVPLFNPPGAGDPQVWPAVTLSNQVNPAQSTASSPSQSQDTVLDCRGQPTSATSPNSSDVRLSLPLSTPSPPGAIAVSRDRNENSKDSGSHLHNVNGLSNGHIPISVASGSSWTPPH